MMRTIVLEGSLGNKYGKEFRLDVNSVGEAVRALSSQIPAFLDDLRQGSFRISSGILSVDEATVNFQLGSAKQIIIRPVVQGAKGGVGKAIVGIALIALAFIAAPVAIGLASTAFSVGGVAVSWGTVALFGTSLALSGVAMMMSPIPKVGNYGDRESPAERPSFLFNGPANTAEQGAAIPVVYGTVRTGSVIISTGLSTEDVASGG